MENRNILSEETMELLKNRQIGLFISALDRERARCLHKQYGKDASTYRQGMPYCTICRATWRDDVSKKCDMTKIEVYSGALIDRINAMKYLGGDYMSDDLVNHLADTILMLQRLPKLYAEIIDILEEQGREFD